MRGNLRTERRMPWTTRLPTIRADGPGSGLLAEDTADYNGPNPSERS
jgi:hypothetical protein